MLFLHADADAIRARFVVRFSVEKVLVGAALNVDDLPVDEGLGHQACLCQPVVFGLNVEDPVLVPDVVIKAGKHQRPVGAYPDRFLVARVAESCQHEPPFGEAMGSNSSSRRTQFPGADITPQSTVDLPVDPLPPERRPEDGARRGLSAPVMLVPIGKLKDGPIERIRASLEEIYRRPTALHQPLPVPKYAYNPTRGQYHSSSILKRVEELYDTSWDCAIGFTDVDLFVPEVPFIFGEADRSSRSAIISLIRLSPESGPAESRHDLMMKRLMSEAIHQLGLIRGLAQCPNNRCVMFDAAVVQEIDKRGSAMCANCRKRLLDLY